MPSESQNFDVEALIASSWKTEAEVREAKRPGLNMSTIIEVADEENLNKLPTTVKNWLAVYDEVGAWVVNLSTLMMSTAMNDGVQLTPFQSSVTCLTGIISAQIIAIRRLVVSGLDVQAKQLLRILTEHVDVVSALSADPQLAAEFALTVDGDTANMFWHRHVKGGRLRKLLFAKLETTMGPELAAELIEFVKQEEKVLSMGIHPSMAAAQMACLPVSGVPEQPFYFGFFGKATIFSERTLSYAVLYLTLYVATGFVPEKRDVDYASAAGQLIGPIQEHVLRGRTAVLCLVARLIPHFRDPALKCDLESALGLRIATDT